MSILKKILKVLAAIVLLLLVVVAGKFILDRQEDYEVDHSTVSVPSYTETDIVFDQGNDFSVSLPFMASAIIDVDGDGVEELFLGGSQTTPDGMFRFQDDKLVAIDGALGVSNGGMASLGSIAVDVDNDGLEDLLVTREDGIWLHRNEGGKFASQKLDAAMPDDTVGLTVAVADINRDGAFDMYVSGYIKFDLVEGQNLFREGYGGSSRLFMNNGDNTFTDKTVEAGLEMKHNTFQAIFLDLDRDGLEDIVVAQDTGHVITWRNVGGVKFERMDNPNSEEFSYPMGIGVTDLGNNGLPDLFFSNVGSSIPNFALRGDLADDQVGNWKWILFENKGDFKFEDVAVERQVADYEFSWGCIFEDLNLDGQEDLLVSENYIGMPVYKVKFLRLNGRLLLQQPDGKFVAAGAAAGVQVREYSISPLTADFNNDGRPDIVHANLNANSKLFLSKAGTEKYLKVKIPPTIQSIGATVTAELSDGRKLSRPYVSGEGLCSDSSRIITFGLKDATVTKVSVSYIDGKSDEKEGNFSNELINLSYE